MIAGIVILIIMILMVTFLARRVKAARQVFDDIEIRDAADEPADAEEEGKKPS